MAHGVLEVKRKLKRINLTQTSKLRLKLTTTLKSSKSWSSWCKTTTALRTNKSVCSKQRLLQLWALRLKLCRQICSKKLGLKIEAKLSLEPTPFKIQIWSTTFSSFGMMLVTSKLVAAGLVFPPSGFNYTERLAISGSKHSQLIRQETPLPPPPS